MSKALAGVDRALFLVLGIVLIALGLWPILIHFQVGFATYLAEWVDHDAWAAAPAQGWWPWALAGATAACGFLGVWLILANLKVRRILKVPSAATDEDGTVTLQMNSIAAGVAASLARQDFVDSSLSKVAFDRARPQLTFTIVAKAETPLATLQELVAETEADFRAAFPDSTLETVFKVHYAKLEALRD